MIGIWPKKLGAGPRELDFGIGVGTEMRRIMQAFPAIVTPKGIFRFPKGTK
jgi:hypothetical protein